MNLRVDPHVYGATLRIAPVDYATLGLSPCVWGHPVVHTTNATISGSIPMCMGPPKSTAVLKAQIRVYPHVYGATQLGATLIPGTMGLSPCVWGHRTSQQCAAELKGSIHIIMRPPNVVSLLLLSQWDYPY